MTLSDQMQNELRLVKKSRVEGPAAQRPDLKPMAEELIAEARAVEQVLQTGGGQ